MAFSSTPLGTAHSELCKRYSDLKIVCRGEEFDVHRIIVCTKSPVLAAACDGGFKEASTNTIHMEQFDPETVKRMLQFMYAKEYDDGVVNEEDTSQQQPNINDGDSHDTPTPTPPPTETPADMLRRHLNVNEIADYYDIPPLRGLANAKIQRILDGTNWRSAGGRFLTVIFEVFRSPPRDTALQKILISAVGAHIEELIELEDFTRESSSELMRSGFAMDLIRNVTRRLQSLQSQLRDRENELQPLRETLQTQRVSLEQETARADRIVKNIENCRRVLSESESCRNIHCDVQFRLCIDRREGPSSNEPRYFVYCKRCGYGQV